MSKTALSSHCTQFSADLVTFTEEILKRKLVQGQWSKYNLGAAKYWTKNDCVKDYHKQIKFKSDLTCLKILVMQVNCYYSYSQKLRQQIYKDCEINKKVMRTRNQRNQPNI